MTISVLALPAFDPGAQRIALELPEGLTVADMVGQIIPAAWREALMPRIRVTLVSARGEMAIAGPETWARIRPKAGVTVVVRVVPANDQLKSVLLVAVSIAAVAAGQLWVGPALAGTLGLTAGTWAAIATAGITIAGGALVNWLLPTSAAAEKQAYQISAWRNSANPNGPVPAILGKHRYAPPYAAPPYIEIVGDKMYIRAAFLVGYGPYALSDLRLGDTPIDSFDNVNTEIRYGYADDLPLSLTPQQFIEEQEGIELVRPFPLDDTGKVISGSSTTETPELRLTAADVTEAVFILNFPQGMWAPPGFLSSDVSARSVDIRLRYRLDGAVIWAVTTTINFSAAETQGFFRAHRFTFPSRGRWEIELTRMTDELVAEDQGKDQVVWFVLQSIRPEYPINFPFPVALIALRVRATHQLNGPLDSFNLVVSRIAPDWDGDSWADAETRNPASAFRYALTAAANAYPQSTGLMIADELEDWHDFCAAKGLKYDRVHDYSASLFDVLSDIARAGRASPRRDGSQWGVVIDRPRTSVVAHLNERNARDITWRRTYLKTPDGVRVTFLDETSNYQSREMVIGWPGFVGDVVNAEELSMPGVTNPTQVATEAYRHMQTVLLRPDLFTATQDGAVRTATRGDLVKANLESIVSTQAALRVKAVRGQSLELDGFVTMAAGQAYGLRFFVVDEDANTWTSTLRTVFTVAGEFGAVTLSGTGDVPQPGQLVQFGLLGSESFDLIVAGVEAGDGMTTVIHAVQAAPEIDALTDAYVPPTWDGRVGDILPPDTTPPEAPVVVSVATDFDSSHVPIGLSLLLRPASDEPLVIISYLARHRLVGAPIWTTTVGADHIDMTPYALGDSVEFQAAAVSLDGVQGAWTTLLNQQVLNDGATVGNQFDYTRYPTFSNPILA